MNKKNTLKITIRAVTLLIFAMFTPVIGIAQNNVVKARAIYFPADKPTYSFGIGYERIIIKNLRVQLLYNSTQLTPGLDARTTKSSGLVPEVRYYFGKKENFRKKPFVGAFVELFKYKEFGGMPSYSPNYYWVEANGNMAAPGILIGKNNSLGKHFLIDMYIGFRIKLFNGTNTFKNVNEELFYEKYTDTRSAIRIGLNLGYLF